MRTYGFIGGFFVLLFAVFIFFQVRNTLHIETTQNVTIKKLQEQQKISGDSKNMKTEFRYLVITDKETFICESSLLNGKFDNSNIFFNLEEGKKYNFKVSGNGKGMFFDYRNILEADEVKEVKEDTVTTAYNKELSNLKKAEENKATVKYIYE